MSQYRSTRRRTSARSSYGETHAERNIREAKELSEKLGGSDEDVKRYFFNLPYAELDKILTEYGRRYNRSSSSNSSKPNAEEYARSTFDRWKSGRRRMSGKVAGRLFDLLPPLMPLSDKHNLVKKLWKTHSPRSNLYITVGLDADVHELVTPIKERLESAVVSYTIPAPLEARFTWISGGDVTVKQQILNHFLHEERRLINEGLRLKIPILMENFRKFQNQTQGLKETITVGGHTVEVVFDKHKNGIKVTENKPITYQPTSSSMRTGSAYSGGTSTTNATSTGSGCLSIILVMLSFIGVLSFLATKI